MQFQLEKNVPEVYVNESRDFQLLCRVIDIYLCSCINNTSIIPYQLDLDKCSESLLLAIANMQGFVTNIYIPPQVLRNICKVFPYCIKRKGTEEAIRTAAYAVLSSDRLIYNVEVEIIKTDGVYSLTITSNAQSDYLPYLKEFLRFIVPPGWRTSIIFANQKDEETSLEFSQSSRVMKISGITARLVNQEGPLGEWNYASGADGVSSQPGMYSRVGYIQILRARSNTQLMSEKGRLYGPSGPTGVSLIVPSPSDTIEPTGTPGSAVFILQNAQISQGPTGSGGA